MEQTLNWAKNQSIGWLAQHGYGAVVPALLLDPGGVPWPWIFLMLLAEEAGKSVPLMIVLGFGVLSVFDHALFFLGRFGRPLLRKLEARWPRVAPILEKSEATVRQHGFWAICAGRFLPFLGRWVGLGSGLANVSWARFALFNAFGVLATVAGFGIVAHFVGRKTIEAPWFPHALFLAFIGGTVVTLGGTAWGVWRARKKAPEAV
jgi:membrane-associated protein